jgi:uncharacterized membrane protein
VTAIIAVDRTIYAIARHWRLLVNSLFFSWLALAVLAPVLVASGRVSLGNALYAVFHPFCHQRTDRSFHILGEKMACCERCAAIYGGLLIFGLAYVAFRRLRPLPWRGLILLSLPIALDATSQAIGLRESTPFWRVATGLLFALGVGWMLFPFLDKGFSEMKATLERRFTRLVSQGRARPLRGAPPPSAV